MPQVDLFLAQWKDRVRKMKKNELRDVHGSQRSRAENGNRLLEVTCRLALPWLLFGIRERGPKERGPDSKSPVTWLKDQYIVFVLFILPSLKSYYIKVVIFQKKEKSL